MRVLVTGATGTLGSKLMTEFAQAGHEPIAMSRKPGPDRRFANVATGEGLAAAVEGVDAIVHAASDPRKDPHGTDVDGTRRLAAFGLPLLYVSIVGVDKNPYKYYQVKREGEQVLEGTPGPWTILRATQFHSFISAMLRLSRSGAEKIPGLSARNAPVIYPTGWQFQPVCARQTAARIVELVADGPTRSIEQFGGPEVLSSETLARTWAEVKGGHPIGMPFIGKASRAFRAGSVVPAPDVPRGTTTWADYLAGRHIG